MNDRMHLICNDIAECYCNFGNVKKKKQKETKRNKKNLFFIIHSV
jgi:hypothetical protein